MSMIGTLITDRTAADVARWLELRNKGPRMTTAELSEWRAGMKGAYNATDLNRVGEALNYIRDRIRAENYFCDVTARTDWAESDIPTAAEVTAYLNSVADIRNALAQFETTPPAPEYTGGLDYQEANNIEQILFDVDLLVTNMLVARYYCGELYMGEV